MDVIFYTFGVVLLITSFATDGNIIAIIGTILMFLFGIAISIVNYLDNGR